jgi:hypothetical protein
LLQIVMAGISLISRKANIDRWSSGEPAEEAASRFIQLVTD